MYASYENNFERTLYLENKILIFVLFCFVMTTKGEDKVSIVIEFDRNAQHFKLISIKMPNNGIFALK